MADKPLKFLCGKVAKNRFAVASLTNCQSNADGTLHTREKKWLERRAIDGYGIVNSCCVHVQANGKGWEVSSFICCHRLSFYSFQLLSHFDSSSNIPSFYRASGVCLMTNTSRGTSRRPRPSRRSARCSSCRSFMLGCAPMTSSSKDLLGAASIPSTNIEVESAR